MSFDYYTADLLPIFHGRWYIFVGAATLYLPAIYVAQTLMSNRKPIKLTSILFCWNAMLSILSAIGFCLAVPWLVNNLMEIGWQATVCSHSWSYDYNEMIAMKWFTIGKIPDLLDTFFIILRKNPIRFLHWYHHFTVLLFCWMACVYSRIGIGIFFAVMNLFVHSVMYAYYASMTIGIRPPFPIVITVLQIAQMAGGTYITWCARLCDEEPFAWWAAFLMYTTYYILFVHFFVDRYILQSGSKSDAKSDAKSGSKSDAQNGSKSDAKCDASAPSK